MCDPCRISHAFTLRSAPVILGQYPVKLGRANRNNKMSDQSEIDLKLRSEFLENENSALKSMLKQQATFGHKITVIVAKMDELLVKKKNGN